MSEFFETFTKEIYVALISMLPFIELRGAIPAGAAMGLSAFTTYVIAVLGNILPIPFILLFARPLVAWFKKTKYFKPLADKLEKKCENNRNKIMKYSAFGLYIFVAIPLPGTGAWSGSLIAALMDMRFKYAFPSIALGVITAGLIMCFGTQIVQLILSVF